MCLMKERGLLRNCYETKRRYQLECDKPLHGGGDQNSIFAVKYLLNDPFESLHNVVPYKRSGFHQKVKGFPFVCIRFICGTMV